MSSFSQDSFEKAIKASFVKAGQAPQGDGTFIKYTSHTRHVIAKDLLLHGKTEDSALSLATVGAVDAITYEEDEEPETDDENEEDDE